eukprot:gene1092-2126_t
MILDNQLAPFPVSRYFRFLLRMCPEAVTKQVVDVSYCSHWYTFNCLQIPPTLVQFGLVYTGVNCY